MANGYSDNRRATFNQIKDKGWAFKTDAEGKSLGKGAGVAIEFFELRDKETKQPFDRHVLDGMKADEREERRGKWYKIMKKGRQDKEGGIIHRL